MVHLRYTNVGRPAEAEALLAPLRAVATPLHDDVRERPITDVDAVHRHSRHPTVDEGGVVLRELPAEAVDALLAAAGPDVPSPLDLVELRAMGGALERPAAIDALAPWSLGRALPNFAGAKPPRGTLVARRPSAAAVQQAVDPDGMFARTPLP